MVERTPIDPILSALGMYPDAWVLAPYKSDEFLRLSDEDNMTIEEFRETSLYKGAVSVGLIVDDEWRGPDEYSLIWLVGPNAGSWEP